jgi:hypothetical protein
MSSFLNTASSINQMTSHMHIKGIKISEFLSLVKMYSRDSFDRFGDDLSSLIFSYFDSSVQIRSLSVSKQWNRCMFILNSKLLLDWSIWGNNKFYIQQNVKCLFDSINGLSTNYKYVKILKVSSTFHGIIISQLILAFPQLKYLIFTGCEFNMYNCHYIIPNNATKVIINECINIDKMLINDNYYDNCLYFSQKIGPKTSKMRITTNGQTELNNDKVIKFFLNFKNVECLSIKNFKGQNVLINKVLKQMSKLKHLNIISEDNSILKWPNNKTFSDILKINL